MTIVDELLLVAELISKTCKTLNIILYQPLREEILKTALKQKLRGEKLLADEHVRVRKSCVKTSLMILLKNSKNIVAVHLLLIREGDSHCVKSVQIRSFFWSVFSPDTGKYGPEKTPYFDTFHAKDICKGVHFLVKLRESDR